MPKAMPKQPRPGHQIPYIVCQGTCDSNEIEDFTLPLAGIRQTDGLFPNWNGPYIQILPLDPWGNNYFIDTDYMTAQGDKAVVGSYGPNGLGLNDYDDDDVIYIINR